MATPAGDSYAVASGGVIAAGRYTTRPVLGAIGHSKVNYEITPDSGVGMHSYAHHKMMNALLRKPFDYVLCNVPASVMGPGWPASNLVNGFYGRGGAGASDILNGTPAGVATYIDQIEELVGARRCLICLEGESNTLYGGTSAASGHACWAVYAQMIALLAAKGWRVAVSEPCPSTYYNTAGNNAAAAAFRDDCLAADAAGTAINLTGMWNSFHDPNDADGYLRPLANYTLDGAHLDFEGMLKRALAFADAFPVNLYPPWQPRPSDVVCSQNPLLAGTGGTLGDNASGVVPNGFTLSGYHTYRSLVGTQTADGYEIDFTYSGPAATDTYTFDLAAALYKANVIEGATVVEALCDIEILECSNFGFQLLTQTGLATGTSPPIQGALDSGQLNWTNWLEGKRLVLHSDPFIYPAGGTRTTASLRARLKALTTSARLRARIRYLGMKQI